MNTSQLTSAESATIHWSNQVPNRIQIERLRLFNLLEQKRKDRERKLRAAKRALAIANKLKNPAAKKKHQSRIFSAMNKLRVAV
jgi:hypothetical protein